MLKAYKYEILPNVKQAIALGKTFGCVRYFWNKQVELFNSYDKENNPKIVYPSSTKVRGELAWMQEVSAAALQQKQDDFKEFRNQRFSTKRKKKVGNPNFKKRGGRQSFRLPNQKFYLTGNKIYIEKVGKVKFIEDRPIPEGCKFMSVTVSKESCGKYYASILVETEIKHFEKTGKTVGIDVGINSLAFLSDGTELKNPKWFRNSQAKLAKAQRRLSRKKKGSSRRKKCKLKVAKLHKRVSNQREWYLHNFTTDLVKKFDIISIEDLNVEGMVKNRKLAKSIEDASFAKMFKMLDYKCEWYGKRLVKIPRFYPSSKQCSQCGHVKKVLGLSQRIYDCDECGYEEKRDYNSAITIDAVGVDIAKRA